MAALYSMDLYLNVGMKCRYSMPEGLDNDAVMALFDQAIAKTVLDHPLMQVGLWEEDSSGPSYLRLDSIDLSKIIFFQELSEGGVDYDNQLHKTYTQLIDTRLGDADVFPGWQIHIFRSKSADTVDVIFGLDIPWATAMQAKRFTSLCSHMSDQGERVLNSRAARFA